MHKKQGNNLGVSPAVILVLMFSVVGLLLIVSRVTDLRPILNLSKAAGKDTDKICQFQIQIARSLDNPPQFSFIVPAMEMTTARVEGIVAINGSGGNDLIEMQGPFDWHPGEPYIWGMTQTLNPATSAVIIQMVAWREDTKTFRLGCGIWQRPPLRVILDTHPYNEIKISKGKDKLSVVFTAPKLLFETGYTRLEGINGYLNYNDQQISWGPYKWVSLSLSNNYTYTHTFSRGFEAVLIGILDWKKVSDDKKGVIKIRFGYGAAQIK